MVPSPTRSLSCGTSPSFIRAFVRRWLNHTLKPRCVMAGRAVCLLASTGGGDCLSQCADAVKRRHLCLKNMFNWGFLNISEDHYQHGGEHGLELRNSLEVHPDPQAGRQ